MESQVKKGKKAKNPRVKLTTDGVALLKAFYKNRQGALTLPKQITTAFHPSYDYVGFDVPKRQQKKSDLSKLFFHFPSDFVGTKQNLVRGFSFISLVIILEY
jgi:polysaccharide deacetylase 2 family uncharacterized protein YibQ